MWYNEKNLCDRVSKQPKTTLGTAFDSAAAAVVAEIRLFGLDVNWSKYSKEQKGGD